MNLEHTFYALSIGDFANRKCLVQTRSATPQDNSLKNLYTLFSTFHHPQMDFQGIPWPKIRHLLLHLFLFNFINDRTHDVLP